MLVLLGCAHGTAARSQEGDGRWRELLSAHFSLRTDVAPTRARDILTGLEKYYAALKAITPFTFASESGPSDQFNVVVFRNAEDFVRLAPRGLQNHRGVNIERDGVEFVVAREPLYQQLLPHELMHSFIRHHLWRAPVWLNEGLATFYSSITVKDDEVSFGYVSPRVLSAKFPPIEKVLHADYREFHEPANESSYYAAAVTLVYVLNSENDYDRRRFVSYVEALARGVPAEEAWRKTFGVIPTGELQRRVLSYRNQMALRRSAGMSAYRDDMFVNTWRGHWTPPRAVEIDSERLLTEFEQRLLMIQICDWSTSMRSWVADQLGRARQERPEDPNVLYWSGWFEQVFGDHTKSRQLFEAAVKARPEDARPWRMLARAELADLEKLPAGERYSGPALEELQRRARSADDFNEVAWYLSEIGKPTEAIPYIVHSLETAPGCYYCRDTMAQIFFQKGAVARAIEEQRLAVNLIPESNPLRRKEYTERLEKYEKAAREAESMPKPSPSPAATPESTPQAEPPQ